MLITLEFNKDKVAKYNQITDELNASQVDDLIFDHVNMLNDVFIPYCDFANGLQESKKHHVFEEDHIELDPANFIGIYICDINDNHQIECLTDYKVVRYNLDSPIYFKDYGVADNASQIIDYYNELLTKHYDYMKEKSFVILMSPIFKDIHTGWRWHKWGRYIGKFPRQCEYLQQERGIDMVYAFHIYEVEREEM